MSGDIAVGESREGMSIYVNSSTQFAPPLFYEITKPLVHKISLFLVASNRKDEETWQE